MASRSEAAWAALMALVRQEMENRGRLGQRTFEQAWARVMATPAGIEHFKQWMDARSDDEVLPRELRSNAMNKADQIAADVRRIAKDRGVDAATVWADQPDMVKAYRAAMDRDAESARKVAKVSGRTVGDVIDRALTNRSLMLQAGEGGRGYLGKKLVEIRAELHGTDIGKKLEGIRRQHGTQTVGAVSKAAWSPEQSMAWNVAIDWANPN